MIFNWFSKDSSEGDQKITNEDETGIVDQFREWMPRIQVLLELQPHLKYGEAIKYFSNNYPQSQKFSIARFHQEIASQFSEWLQDFLQKAEIVPVMTYEEAMQYFVTNRPSDPRVKKGGILREPHPEGQFLAQLFLDGNNQIVYRRDGKPYGRYLVAKKLDEELEDTFDNKDLIIVE